MPFRLEALLDEALALLLPLRPTKQEIDHLILRTPHETSQEKFPLALFATAGYQLLPEETVVYTLDTSGLDFFGTWLKKDLVVAGTLGDNVGFQMSGRLTIDGRVNNLAGYCMIGTLVNNGIAHDNLGDCMIGTLVNNGTAGHGCANGLYGVFDNKGKMPTPPRIGALGMWHGHRRLFGFPLSWSNIRRKDREAFLHDITNPEGRSYTRLRIYLHNNYRWYR
jgi:hypothetical protein